MEDRRSKDDKMSKRMQKAVEASVREVRLGKIERGRGERRSRKEMIRKGEEEEAEERKNGGGQESSGRVGNLG